MVYKINYNQRGYGEYRIWKVNQLKRSLFEDKTVFERGEEDNKFELKGWVEVDSWGKWMISSETLPFQA